MKVHIVEKTDNTTTKHTVKDAVPGLAGKPITEHIKDLNKKYKKDDKGKEGG